MTRSEFNDPDINSFENPYFDKQILTGPEVLEQTRLLAMEIVRDYKDKPTLFVVNRNGAIRFGGLLLREIGFIEPSFQRCAADIKITASGPDSTLREPQLVRDVDVNVSGLHLLFVEDIIDRGATMHFAIALLESRQPASVETVALLERVIDDRSPGYRTPKYVGFRLLGNGYAIGTGLDDNRVAPDFGRSIPGIALNFPPGE